MITIKKTSKTITAEGHAETLICNSVSILFQHTLHALEIYSTDYHATPSGANGGFFAIEIDHNQENDLFFGSLVNSLRILSEQFPKEVRLIEET